MIASSGFKYSCLWFYHSTQAGSLKLTKAVCCVKLQHFALKREGKDSFTNIAIFFVISKKNKNISL
jgi:hypothetical protein